MDKIIQIDLSILDKEIETLKAELQKKQALRDYIKSLAKTVPDNSASATSSVPAETPAPKPKPTPVPTPVKKAATPSKAAPKKATPVKAPAKTTPVKTATKSAPAKTASKKAAPSKGIGLTEFVLDYLKKNPKSGSKVITDSFIKTTGNKAKGVKFNVANTLSRLRKENKLKVQDAPGGSGYLWSVK